MDITSTLEAGPTRRAGKAAGRGVLTYYQKTHLNTTQMQQLKLYIYSLLISQLITSCNSSTASSPVNSKEITGNYLSMKINGVVWEADSEIFGAFHPKGYDNVIMMGGSFGPKNKDEQPFNINLYNTPGPGDYHIKDGNKDYSVAQLANLSTDNYLYGSVLGFDIKVKLIKASANPTVIEATFEGTLNGNASDVLKITDGKFRYIDDF